MDLEVARMRVVLGTMGLTVGGTFVAWALQLGWPASTVLTLLASLIFAFYLYRTRDHLLALLCVAGLVAGFGELATDYWADTRFNALVYPAGEPLIWSSPAYMPFAWAVIVVQLGAIGHWLAGRYGLAVATLLTALIGGVNIPLYEYLAKGANLWHYQNCWMLAQTTPYFIILFEILISLLLPYMARRLDRGRVSTAVMWGAIEAAWMWVALVIAWALVGQPPS